MKITRLFLVILLSGILIAGLSACERSLSPANNKKPAESVPGEAQPTNDVMGQLEMFVTQTALAMKSQAQSTPEPDQPTPAMPVVTKAAMPTPEPAQPTAAQPPETAVPAAPTNPPAAVVVPTATPGIPASYTLQKDEYPFCIARRFNVDPQELLSINSLGTHTTVYSGYLLRIPQSGKQFIGERMLKPHPASHTAAAGETIYSIACQYGDVDPLAIAFANSLAEPYTLTAGQTLQIP